MFKRLKQMLCQHRFYLDQLGTRDAQGMLHVPCHKCGKVCTANCGLDLPGILDGYAKAEGMCMACGEDSLDTGWECTVCGADNRPYFYHARSAGSA